MDMDFSHDCKQLSFVTPSKSSLSGSPILKRDPSKYAVSNGGTPSCDVIDCAVGTEIDASAHGSVVKKLSIFERIKLLNNDTAVKFSAPKEHILSEIRPKCEPESAVVFREKSSDGE